MVQADSGILPRPRRPSLSGPVVIPQSKTRRPRRLSGALVRDRVVSRMAGADGDVVLVLAPAGFGKTTLIGQWADATERPVGWATLGATDRDPVVLMSTMLAALHDADVGLVKPRGLLTGDEPAFTRRVLPSYQRAIESIDRPVTLVVDDIHAMAGVLATVVLVATVDALPEGSRIALVGRGRPDLPVDLWRGQHRLVEVGTHELSFDPDETRECLRHTLGRDPGAADARAVQTATNGWPVGVYLQGISLQRTGMTSPSASAAVQDYLDAEVLGRLDPGLMDFLRRTSILSAQSGQLCDQVLATTGCAELLRESEAATLLVSRLEGPGGWYRMHPLLRERLLDQLVAHSTSDAAQLHARAATWYAAHGQSDEAMAHALQSEDLDLLGSLTWDYAKEALFLGRTSTVLGWLRQIIETDIAATPALALIAAWTAVTTADGPGAQRWAEATAVALGPDWIEHLDRSELEPALAILVCLGGTMPFDAAAEMLALAAQALPVTEWLRSLALTVSGWFQVLSGARDDGLETLAHAHMLGESMKVGTTSVEAPTLIGFVLAHEGKWRAAEEMATAGHAAWAEYDLQDMATSTGLLFSLSALLAARRGELSRARVDLARTEPLTHHLSRVLPTLAVVVETFVAKTSALLGDATGAKESLDRASSALDRVPPSPWLVEVVEQGRREVGRASPLALLTRAELKVWSHLASRQTLREIADSMYLSPDTIKSHLRSIYRKLGVSSRREALALVDPTADLEGPL